MAKLQLGELQFNYSMVGPANAPVIVFSNSLGANLTMWEPQIEFFQKKFRVLTYDQRGHGQTDVSEQSFQFDDLAYDVVRLINALDIEKVHFVGLSMGGMTALGLAIKYPERLLSVTASNCVASFSPEARQAWTERASSVSANGLEPILDATIQRWFTETMISNRPDDIAGVRAMILNTTIDGYVGCCGAIRDLDYMEGMASIGVKTLLIGGTYDLGTPPTEMKKMSSLIPGSKYVELDTAHVSNLEAPAEFNQTLDQFLSEV
jgi:3-oxoadipate enol-lactonase